MAEKINLRSSRVKEQKRRVADYGTETPLSSTAVERGTTRWLSGSRVDIDGVLNVSGTANVSGLLDVTGTASVSGALNVSGTTTLSGSTTIAGPTGITGALTIAGSMDVTGPSTFAGTLGINGATTITGQLDVTGPSTFTGTLGIDGDTTITGLLDITGDTTITGLLDITGRTTISNDLELLAGGLFKAGVTEIEPNGKASFGDFIIDPSSNKLIEAPGGWLFSNGPGSIGLADSGASSMQLASDRAELNYKGTSVIRAEQGLINLNAPQTSVNGNLVVTGTVKVGSTTELTQTRLRVGGIPTTSVAVANVHVDSNGIFYRVA